MESLLSSDESNDSETKNMKNQLSEFGVDEDMTKEEMTDLLKALNNSKSSVMKEEEELLTQKVEDNDPSPPPRKAMKRRYLHVRDRRMPWCLLPSNITPAQKACTLAVYIKLMSINRYRQARKSSKFTEWPPSLQIVEESRVQPLRATRSGRNVPVYQGCDDDDSDIDFVVTKPKKRKVSQSDQADGVYSNKVVSLKRKGSKEDSLKGPKENKIEKCEASTSGTSTSVRTKKDLFSSIEE